MPQMIEIKTMGYRCERCRHEWVPLRSGPPRVCPKCKSPYWDKPRRSQDDAAAR